MIQEKSIHNYVQYAITSMKLQNPNAAVFGSCPDEKQVTVIDFSLGTSRSGYVTIVPHVVACKDFHTV